MTVVVRKGDVGVVARMGTWKHGVGALDCQLFSGPLESYRDALYKDP